MVEVHEISREAFDGLLHEGGLRDCGVKTDAAYYVVLGSEYYPNTFGLFNIEVCDSDVCLEGAETSLEDAIARAEWLDSLESEFWTGGAPQNEIVKLVSEYEVWHVTDCPDKFWYKKYVNGSVYLLTVYLSDYNCAKGVESVNYVFDSWDEADSAAAALMRASGLDMLEVHVKRPGEPWCLAMTYV